MSYIHDFLLENVHLPVDAWTVNSVAEGLRQIAQIPKEYPYRQSTLNAEYQLVELRLDFTGPNFRHGALLFAPPAQAAVVAAAAILVGCKDRTPNNLKHTDGNAANEGLESEPDNEVKQPVPEIIAQVKPLVAFGDETVVDIKNELMWARRAAPQRLKWNDADQYCTDLVMAGRDDWRLPSIGDLKSLIRYCGKSCEVGPACLTMDCAQGSCAPCPDNAGPAQMGAYWDGAMFDGMGSRTSWYSSSSRIIGRPNGLWVAGFHRGHVSDGSINTKYAVRCVTKAPEEKISAATNDSLQSKPTIEKKVKSGPKLVAKGGLFLAFEDGTVVDILEQLMWTRESAPSRKLFRWHEAKQYCDDLVLANRSDWHLPDIGELRRLIDGCSRGRSNGPCKVRPGCLNVRCWTSDDCRACTKDQGPAKHGEYWEGKVFDLDGFDSSPSPWYSSSSRIEGRAPGDHGLWVVGFHLGHVSDGSIIKEYAVRCVTKAPEEKLSVAKNNQKSKIPATEVVHSIDDDDTSAQGKAEPQQRGMADRVIDYGIDRVTPESTGTIREVQRDAVKFLLDPNAGRSEEHLDNMIKGIRKVAEGEKKEE